MADNDPPIEEDRRFDDEEFNPQLEPKSSKAWLNLLRESEKAFEQWNLHCDNIEKQYASLARLSQMAREKEFQLFWANMEVLKPSIYARAPVPVVSPKFKDRRPVYQAASEVLERCCLVAFDLTRINDLMLLVRDDVALLCRGVAWCRYDSTNYDYEQVCIDYKDRRDFLHSVSRNWREVWWVASASYLTRSEASKRFSKYSGDAYQEADYKVDKDAQEIGGADKRERAKFWEIWDKKNKRVVWVAEGVDDILDEDDPEIQHQNFFPCPKPAYGTVQKGSLVPVPDVMQYKDQLEEINEVTGRIHALAEALEVKGFYPAGGSEIAEAVEKAIKTHTPGRLLVPISNWAAFGGSKEVIIWLPIDQIASVITALVALRKQLIDDVYQIMGLSDIMRGSTDPNETLGAQELKTQYGSTRVRDKQAELVRIARDLVEITSEIMTGKFATATMIEMSQTQIPTQAMVEHEARRIADDFQRQQQQAQMMLASPQMMQQAQQNPQALQAAQQALQQAQAQAAAQLQQLQAQPTIEQVMRFLKDKRAKAFTLDIETDSTIQPDEDAEKQRRTEFIGVLGGLLPQLSQMIIGDPSTAPFAGELLKFATAPFRVGRSLDGSIDELVEQMKNRGPRGDDPTTAQNKIALQIEQMKVQQKDQSEEKDRQLKAQELAMKDKHETQKIQNARDIELMKLRQGQNQERAKIVQNNQKTMQEREKHQAEMIGKRQDMALNAQKMQVAQQTAQARQADMVARQQDRRAQQQFRQQQVLARPRPI